MWHAHFVQKDTSTCFEAVQKSQHGLHGLLCARMMGVSSSLDVMHFGAICSAKFSFIDEDLGTVICSLIGSDVKEQRLTVVGFTCHLSSRSHLALSSCRITVNYSLTGRHTQGADLDPAWKKLTTGMLPQASEKVWSVHGQTKPVSLFFAFGFHQHPGADSIPLIHMIPLLCPLHLVACGSYM